MLSHVQDFMADREAYGWSVVLEYHAAGLQHLGQGRSAWENHAMKLKLRHVLVWHRVAPTFRAPASPSQPGKQSPPSNRSQRGLDPTVSSPSSGHQLVLHLTKASVWTALHIQRNYTYAATVCTQSTGSIITQSTGSIITYYTTQPEEQQYIITNAVF